MESNFRFGIIERLTVAAFVAGVAGVAASLSLPAPYQEFLASTGIGPILFLVSVAIIVASILFFLCDLILHICKKMGVREKMALVAIGTVLIVIGSIIGLIGAFRTDVQESPSLPRATEPASSPPRAAETSIIVDISHDMLPAVSPPDGIIQLFEIREAGDGVTLITPDPDGINSRPIKYQFNPSSAIDWSKSFPEWPIFGVSKCEVTSTNGESVFEAIIPLHLVFQEMVPDTQQPSKVGDFIQSTGSGTQMRSGAVILTRDAAFSVGRINPQNPYVIYFVNRTKYLVTVQLPPTGITRDFSKSGQDFEQKIALKLGRMTGTYLPPSSSPSKSPPAPLPPAPSPPNKPEKSSGKRPAL
jgi:hypothetical protein